MDPITGKWVVRNWDGTIAGIENGHLRSFDKIGMEEDTSFDGGTDGNASSSHNQTETQRPIEVEQLPPFAKIELVMVNSPAKEAGLKKGDKIVKFGTIDHSNHRMLRALGEIVSNSHMDGAAINLDVLRPPESGIGKDRNVILKLRPRQWSGQGLVGCTFSPILP